MDDVRLSILLAMIQVAYHAGYNDAQEGKRRGYVSWCIGHEDHGETADHYQPFKNEPWKFWCVTQGPVRSD